MRRRTLLVVAAVLALNAALWLAQAGGALPASLGSYFFGPKLVRAEVVLKAGGMIHDYRVDRGRIRAVSSSSLTLAERDGSLVTVPVSPSVGVTLGGSPSSISALRRGMHATAIRDGASAPVSQIVATRR